MIKLILSTVSIRASIYLGMVGLVWAIKPLERSWYFLNSGNNLTNGTQEMSPVWRPYSDRIKLPQTQKINL